jgi:hypothetical protein
MPPVLTVATPLDALVHDPPLIVLDKPIVDPAHTVDGPDIVPDIGTPVTVTVTVENDEEGSVYVNVTIPAAIPVATPVKDDMVAIPDIELLQVPPAGVAI